MAQSMEDTAALREKMLALWTLFEQGKLSATEARVHIGFARTLVETLKVEIAAAHLGTSSITAMGLASRASLPLRSLGSASARRKAS